MNSQIENYLIELGINLSIQVFCSRHEFPDLIFLKAYRKFDTVKVSRSMGSTRYDSAKDIKTVYLGTVFLCAVNILKRSSQPAVLF